MRTRLWACLVPCLTLVMFTAGPSAAEERLRLSTTTSAENSGLLYVLLPPFEKAEGVKVDVVAVGTGKALALGQRCDADLLLVHAPALEEKFVADGFGVDRRKIMHNYFAIAGPAADPAGVRAAKSAPEAVRLIAEKKAVFVSRGDESGTHQREKKLWSKAGVAPDWPRYLEAGRGMGAVLAMASEMGSYTLTDTGTFLKYKEKGKLDLVLLSGPDDMLYNPYSVMLVNPRRCPKAKTALAQKLIDYLVSPAGQKIIADYRVAGQPLFVPAHPPR